MRERYYTKNRLALYLIPILIGLGGVVFSQQLDNLGLRLLVLLLSVSVPFFAGGHLLARYRVGRLGRLILLGGVLMLFVGAVLSIWGLTPAERTSIFLPESLAGLTRVLGVVSLLLGLFAVLSIVVRTGEDIDEIGERFWHLAEHISEGFILSRADGTITLVNNQFLEMFDLGREDVLGHNAAELAGRMNAPVVQDHLRTRSHGLSSEYEVTWSVRGEERRFWFHGTPLYNDEGEHRATLATVRDITEHHRLSQRVERYAQGLQRLVEEQTEKLRRSEERFRQLLLSMNEGFLAIGMDNHIRFANDHIGRLLGAAADELIGRDLFDFVDTHGRVRLLNLLAKGASMGGGETRQEMDFINGRGEEVPVMVAVAYVRDAGQEETVYSLVVTGLAEQKEMRRQLEERARELERANEELRLHGRARDGFLSNVSHELRTPLSTVQGYVEMLESGSLGEMDGPQLGALKVMQRNLKRLVALINEMIEFSRMEIRGIKVNLRLFSPARLVQEGVSSIHPHALAKDIAVDVYAEEEFPYCWGDREKLSQVLGILLNNAVKFTEQGGIIQVRVAERSEDTLAVSVTDSGIGIADAYKEQVFEKFFQVDSSKTRRYEGTGIGLSIAKSVIEAHGGHIELESEPGKGSCFTVVLPGAIVGMDYSEDSVAGFQDLAILVVDPDRGLFGGLARALGSRFRAFEQAPNGYEAVRAAEALQPDAVFLNDSRSDVGGGTTVSLLRQNPATDTTPIIVFSAESAERLQEVANVWDDVYFIQTPFTVDALVKTVHKACSGVSGPRTGVVVPAQPQPARERAGVVLVDSDPGFLEWAEMGLALRGVACYTADSLVRAMDIIAREKPGAVIMDVDVPGARAREEVSRFLQRFPDGPPLYLMTGVPSFSDEYADVAGILHKPFSMDALVEIVAPAGLSPDTGASAVET